MIDHIPTVNELCDIDNVLSGRTWVDPEETFYYLNGTEVAPWPEHCRDGWIRPSDYYPGLVEVLGDDEDDKPDGVRIHWHSNG